MSDPAAAPFRIAVIGAGVAGASCADGLRRAGLDVTLFEKSPRPGGRMATRTGEWTDRAGQAHATAFDHGVHHFVSRHPRFRSVLQRAARAGVVEPWSPRLHCARAGVVHQPGWVAVPDMPSLAAHLIGDAPLRTGQTVQRLQRRRSRGGARWEVVTAESGVAGRFDAVMLAMPPAQSAALLAGHQDRWADALAARTMAPCWTLMAVTDDVDWCWDAAEPDRGPIGWVGRDDRKPGRAGVPGTASWVAHATTSWSAARLEADPEQVCDQLCAALATLVPGGHIEHWHHAVVQRWRYAVPAACRPADGDDCWWDAELGLGVCGDALAGDDVEAAWRSGDELADTVAAWVDLQVESIQA